MIRFRLFFISFHFIFNPKTKFCVIWIKTTKANEFEHAKETMVEKLFFNSRIFQLFNNFFVFVSLTLLFLFLCYQTSLALIFIRITFNLFLHLSSSLSSLQFRLFTSKQDSLITTNFVWIFSLPRNNYYFTRIFNPFSFQLVTNMYSVCVMLVLLLVFQPFSHSLAICW